MIGRSSVIIRIAHGIRLYNTWGPCRYTKEPAPQAPIKVTGVLKGSEENLGQHGAKLGH